MATPLLDVTRLAARVGRGVPTGIDRVERAYLVEIAARNGFALLQTRFGYALLRASEAWRILSDPAGDAARALKGAATGKVIGSGLPGLIARTVPAPAVYLNVGHTGLEHRTLARIAAVPGLTVAVMIHDTIPLDHPVYNGPGAAERFSSALRAVSRHAGLVVANSDATAADARRWLTTFGRVPPIRVGHLGVSPASPDPAALPPELPPRSPYFVTVGTIEPRKNHALLLDVWERLARERTEPPTLVIAGRRGWANDAVFRRLDAARGGAVREYADLPDPALSALVAGASAVLMPSLAEGFGLPVGEAIALGTPVIASDLPVYREFAHDYPIYLNPSDLYAWSSTITAAAEQDRAASATEPRPRMPTWRDHFAMVLDASP